MISRLPGPTMTVVEWTAPVRDHAWVAACFGTVDR